MWEIILYVHCTIVTEKSRLVESMKENPGKKVSGKKTWKKKLRKKSEFNQVLGKNVTGNKALRFGFLGLFSLK